MTAGKYRVVQWATGNIGQRSLRAVLEHPRLSLVGLWVHSEAKAGRDAGELCGLPSTGVRATRSLEEILALRPDCVLHTRPAQAPHLTHQLGDAGLRLAARDAGRPARLAGLAVRA